MKNEKSLKKIKDFYVLYKKKIKPRKLKIQFCNRE